MYNRGVSLDLEFGKDEVPPYAFCESVYATSRSRWCIREILTKLKLGGGIDGPSLCGRLKVGGGWDLNVRINDRLLKAAACPKCVEIYRERIK